MKRKYNIIRRKTKCIRKKKINNRGRAVETFLSNCCLVRCLDFWIPLPILRDTYSKESIYDKNNTGNETEKATLRYIPESIDNLQSLTKFSKQELKMLYRNFKNECPNGTINEETLKHIYGQFFPDGDSDTYAHLVYKSFDRGNLGYINFERFAIGLSRLLRGTLKDRLRWTFELYDAKGMGYITKEDVAAIVRSIYKLLGNCANPPLSEESELEHVDRVFTKFDQKSLGKVDFEDFYRVCTNDESVIHSMSVFDHTM